MVGRLISERLKIFRIEHVACHLLKLKPIATCKWLLCQTLDAQIQRIGSNSATKAGTSINVAPTRGYKGGWIGCRLAIGRWQVEVFGDFYQWSFWGFWNFCLFEGNCLACSVLSNFSSLKLICKNLKQYIDCQPWWNNIGAGMWYERPLLE